MRSRPATVARGTALPPALRATTLPAFRDAGDFRVGEGVHIVGIGDDEVIRPGQPHIVRMPGGAKPSPGADDGPKCTWPELVGQASPPAPPRPRGATAPRPAAPPQEPAEAEAAVRRERPDVQVQVMEFLSFGTTDFDEGRVRLWLGEDGRVMRPPRCG